MECERMSQLVKATPRRVLAEVLNAVTHGIAVILGIIGTVYLILKGINLLNPTAIVAYSIYGSSMILLFLNSTLYHSLTFTKFRNLFQKLDHAAIYLLIAGTYTPYLMVSIGGVFGYFILALIWIVAIAGIIFEVVAIDKWPKLSTFLYLAMGWFSLILIKPLLDNIHHWGVILLALGGVAYSIGTIFYKQKHNKWMHVIWHLFVMAGAMFMFYSIYCFVG